MPLRSGLWKKLTLSLCAFLGTAGALECAARAWLRLPAPVLLRDHIYLNPLPLVNGRPTDRGGTSLKGPPLGVKKERGEVRIFVFGESSVEGMPWGPPLSAPTFLFDRLDGKSGDARMTIVNMGRASSFTMDTYYYLISIREYRPDFVIFYLGTNDRYDVEPELCLPANHPHVYSAWRWLVERSRLLSFLRIMGPEKLSWRTSPAKFSRPGRHGCNDDDAFQRWTDILVETAAATGARVIVTSPIKNSLAQLEDHNSAGKAALSQEDFFAQLDPDYRSLLRCFLSPRCDSAGALREQLRRHPRARWQPDYRPWLDCLLRPRCDLVATLLESLRPGHAFLAWRLGQPEGSDETWLDSLRDSWRRSASRHGAEFIDFGRFLKEATPGGFLGFPYVIDEVHLSPEGYWLLAGLWQARIARLLPGAQPPASRSAAGLDLAKYRKALPLSIDDILVNHGVSYLQRKMPLIACPMLKLAADKYHNKKAAGILHWLRHKAGLRPTQAPPGPAFTL
jgi:lysophospholipase L1-like esterase